MVRTAAPAASERSGDRLTVAGLFAGIGGIELGLHRTGHETELLCELDEPACRVLGHRFPGVAIHRDVRDLRSLPDVDLLTAGFPCQDLSQAGRTVGIRGSRSGLVGEVFRLLDDSGHSLRWLLLENVPFMLQLDRGRAMEYLTSALEDRGLTWAYRVVDTRAFGLPQRRQRVILLASRSDDPRDVLFADDHAPRVYAYSPEYACGFYWTEGTRGLGWAVNAVPTLKGGSTVGIPSPPAIMLPRRGSIVTPEIDDAERLQGFPSGWTRCAPETPGRRNGPRWKLVGNAVSVPLAKWVGSRLANPGAHDRDRDSPLVVGGRWPVAAWGTARERHSVDVGMWPARKRHRGLATFLTREPRLLSERATRGFLRRAESGNLRFVEDFLPSVRKHLRRMERMAGSAAQPASA